MATELSASTESPPDGLLRRPDDCPQYYMSGTAVMDMPLNVPVDDPNADTEWNDILRKHKIIPEKPPSPTPIIQAAIEEARTQAHANRLADKDLEQLDDLEDEEDEDFLKQYRDKRLAELSEISHRSLYQQVYPIQKPDYARDVTEASNKAYVLVHLTSSQGTNVESRLLTELFRQLALKYGDIKFCEIKADMCIEHYPEKNTPTILIYRDGDIKRQIITLQELSGARTTIKDIEKVLIVSEALKPDDHRISKSDRTPEAPYSSIRTGNGSTVPASTDDDEWD